MLRSRVRRSFTVEVKSKSRQTSSWAENPTPSPVNWAALDPAPETISPFAHARSEEPSVPVRSIAAEAPRRILPSLLVAEPEPDAPQPAADREPRLPRVRRVKPVPSDVAGSGAAASEVPRSDAIWSFADIDHAPAETKVPKAQLQPAFAVSAPPPARKPSKAWSATPALAPGERWKRRLPRACR